MDIAFPLALKERLPGSFTCLPAVSPGIPAGHLKSRLFVPVQVLCRESSGILKTESKKPKVSQVDQLYAYVDVATAPTVLLHP